MTLNVNNTGAKAVTFGGGYSIPANFLQRSTIYEFVYNGAGYQLVESNFYNQVSLKGKDTLIRYNETTNKIEFVIAGTVVGTLSNTGVFNCNELTENTGTTL